MIIETINATLFPIFLFIVFFSTACCFLYSPAEAETNRNLQYTFPITSSNSEPDTSVNPSSNTNNETSCPSSLQVEKPEPLIQKQPIPEEAAIASTPISTTGLASVAINTQRITLRQARAIASAIKKANPSLGIKQKVNGSDASVEWLRVQIKNRLEQAPELVTPIILELAPAASGVQSQSAKTSKTTTSRRNAHKRKAS